MPAFIKFYVADYLGDTMHLTTEEHGAYLLLIFAYWRNGGPLADDEKVLSEIVKKPSLFFRKKLRPSLAKFFEIRDGFWTHKRIESELNQASRISKVRSKAGSKRAANAQQNVNKRGSTRDRVSDLRAQKEVAPPLVYPPPTSGANDGRRRGTRLPTDWQPDPADCAFATELALNPRQVADEFRDYWHAIAGRKATRLDWHATFRNACRLYATRHHRGNGVQRPGKDRQPAAGFTAAIRRAFADAHDDDLV
jgi:uncharacterized protein YdaU (DUF1376 family)